MTKIELINKIRNNRSFDLRASEFYEPLDISDETIKDMSDDFYYLLKEVLNYLTDKEEHVSNDLEKEIEQYCIHHGYLDSFKDCGYTFNEQVGDIARHFANWQKQQDQSTIELAEDHAMFAGMEKMKEQMIAKAIDAELYSDGMLTPIIKVNDKEKISDIKFGDEVKVIVIKKG